MTLRPEIREKVDAIHRRILAGAAHVVGVHARFSGHYGALHLRPDRDFDESIIADIDDWLRQHRSGVARGLTCQRVVGRNSGSAARLVAISRDRASTARLMAAVIAA